MEIKEGGSFGEIALLESCTRKAGIFCSKDCEFAVIKKRSDGDFTYLLRWEQRLVEAFLMNFDIFNWWVQRKKLGELYPYLRKVTSKGLGDYIYKAGEKITNIF